MKSEAQRSRIFWLATGTKNEDDWGSGKGGDSILYALAWKHEDMKEVYQVREFSSKLGMHLPAVQWYIISKRTQRTHLSLFEIVNKKHPLPTLNACNAETNLKQGKG